MCALYDKTINMAFIYGCFQAFLLLVRTLQMNYARDANIELLWKKTAYIAFYSVCISSKTELFPPESFSRREESKEGSHDPLIWS